MLETLEHEMLDDQAWLTELEESDGDWRRAVGQTIIDVPREHVEAKRPARLAPEDLDLLFPKDAPARAVAIEGIDGMVAAC